jgi:gpW
VADCADLKARLDKLSAARDRLLTGESARVIVDSDGSRVEYTSIRMSDLIAAIAKAQAAYDACTGATGIVTRPLQFFFR